MVGVEEGLEFRFRGDLYSQESTFPLVSTCIQMRPFTLEFANWSSVQCIQCCEQAFRVLALSVRETDRRQAS